MVIPVIIHDWTHLPHRLKGLLCINWQLITNFSLKNFHYLSKSWLLKKEEYIRLLNFYETYLDIVCSDTFGGKKFKRELNYHGYQVTLP